jgi:uncharacterized protein (DUF433 family)
MTPSGARSLRVLGERRKGVALSYLQLIEVAMVATLRSMGVSLKRLRVARDFLATRFQAEYPFAQLKLKTDGAHVMKDLEESEGPWVRRLLVPSAYGQIAWAEPIEDRIHEFDYDAIWSLAVRWYPRGADGPIVVDPKIAFGAPITRVGSIPTSVIKGRYQSGEEIAEIVDDFQISSDVVRGALAFERVQPFAAIA